MMVKPLYRLWMKRRNQKKIPSNGFLVLCLTEEFWLVEFFLLEYLISLLLLWAKFSIEMLRFTRLSKLLLYSWYDPANSSLNFFISSSSRFTSDWIRRTSKQTCCNSSCLVASLVKCTQIRVQPKKTITSDNDRIQTLVRNEGDWNLHCHFAPIS